MAGENDFSEHDELIAEASAAFRIDPAYAIAMAKQAGALHSRREAKAQRDQDRAGNDAEV